MYTDDVNTVIITINVFTEDVNRAIAILICDYIDFIMLLLFVDSMQKRILP